jgi:hypothetical protein
MNKIIMFKSGSEKLLNCNEIAAPSVLTMSSLEVGEILDAISDHLRHDCHHHADGSGPPPNRPDATAETRS